MNKKIIIVLLFCLFDFLVFSKDIYAINSTPSATPSQDLQDKIKSLVKENLETTENVIKNEITSKSLLGYVGKVKSVGIKNITLETEKDLLQISVLPTTQISKSGAEIKTSSIALSDKLIVIGIKNKDGVLEAKTITVVPEQDPATLVTTKAEIATISKIDYKKKTFTLTINNQSISFTLSKKSTVKLEDLTEGDTIFCITKMYQGKSSLSRAVKI